MPVFDQVVVHRFVVNQDMLRELIRIVVEKIAECFNYLSDDSGEIGIVFR